MPPNAEAPYSVGTPPEWDAGVDRFELQASTGAPRRYVLSGPCPRCGHLVQKDITDYVAPALAPGATGQTITVRVTCNCNGDHKGQPDRKVGCGAEGGIALEF